MLDRPKNLVCYRFEDLELDVTHRRLSRGEEPVRLTKLTFELLLALVQSAPDVAAHGELVTKVWGARRIVTPETLAQRIRILRRCLGDSARRPRYIEGVRGYGYKLIPQVRALVCPGPAPGAGRQSTPRERAAALFSQALDLRGTNDHGPSVQLVLKRAIEIDPGFAPAYALLAYIETMSAYVDGGSGRAELVDLEALVERSRRNAWKALELNPDSGMAAAALAGIDTLTWHWTEARRGFDRANELGWASDLSPWFYCWSGDPATGIARARADMSYRSGSAAAHRDLGISLVYAGNLDEAQVALDRALELAPAEAVTRAWRAHLAVRRGETAAISNALEELAALLASGRPVALLPELAYCYGRTGNPRAARRLAETVAALAQQRPLGAGTLAMAGLAAGEKADALRQLEHAAAQAANHEPQLGMMNLMNLRMNFLDDPTLEEPAFVDARSRMCGD